MSGPLKSNLSEGPDDGELTTSGVNSRPMPFHVHVFARFNARQHAGQSWAFVNLDEEQLRSRIVDAWDKGLHMTWGGETATTELAKISIFETEKPIDPEFRNMEDKIDQMVR